MLSKLDTNNYEVLVIIEDISVGWHGAFSKPLHQYVERRAA